MADEQIENDTPEPRQLTEVEQRAMNEGWVPQDEWAGDPDQWRPAKEFLDRGELFRKIDEQKRELKQMKSAMEEFGKHHAQVKELAYKQALADLRAQKKQALEDGDAEAVVAIDDKIADVREAQKVAEATPAPQEPASPHPEFARWEARNPWYKTDRAMKVVADDVARDLVSRGETDPVKILTEVDRQVRAEFPNKFENQNRTRPGAVESTVNKGRSSDKDEVSMTDAEKAIMKRIIATGVITKEKYLEEFKARQAG